MRAETAWNAALVLLSNRFIGPSVSGLLYSMNRMPEMCIRDSNPNAQKRQISPKCRKNRRGLARGGLVEPVSYTHLDVYKRQVSVG